MWGLHDVHDRMVGSSGSFASGTPDRGVQQWVMMMINIARGMFGGKKSSLGFGVVKELAQRMSEHVSKTLPVKVMINNRGQLSANRIARTLEQCYAMVLEVHQQRKLGYLRRVVLASDLRWELQEMGYPRDFVNLTVEGLIVELSKSGSGT